VDSERQFRAVPMGHIFIPFTMFSVISFDCVPMHVNSPGTILILLFRPTPLHCVWASPDVRIAFGLSMYASVDVSTVMPARGPEEQGAAGGTIATRRLIVCVRIKSGTSNTDVIEVADAGFDILVINMVLV
jgi:hypothetical protein